MNTIAESVFRYGGPSFDRQCIECGLHSREAQVAEARSVLRVCPAPGLGKP